MEIAFGLVPLTWWQALFVVLGTTHLTILSVTIYLHRHQAHSALALHPIAAHAFRFWLWFSTGIRTKEWVAIHRKHHAFCETENDPHSPVVLGFGKVLSEGYELYREAATEENCSRFGKRTPEDWIEHNLYAKHTWLGIALMATLFLIGFGVHGVWMWAVQMVWIPFFAAGVINGAGHTYGYRNFECSDNARNLIPFGFLIGGEELHNNHHSFPNSPKLSQRAFEFDIGWAWIRALMVFGLAKPNPVRPLGTVGPEREVTDETIATLRNLRHFVTNEFRRRVLEMKDLGVRARQTALLVRPESILSEADRERKANLLAIPKLSVRTEFFDRLSAIFNGKIKGGLEGQLQSLKQWCLDAEASGDQALQEFALYLRGFRLGRV